MEQKELKKVFEFIAMMLKEDEDTSPLKMKKQTEVNQTPPPSVFEFINPNSTMIYGDNLNKNPIEKPNDKIALDIDRINDLIKAVDDIAKENAVINTINKTREKEKARKHLSEKLAEISDLFSKQSTDDSDSDDEEAKTDAAPLVDIFNSSVK